MPSKSNLYPLDLFREFLLANFKNQLTFIKKYKSHVYSSDI